jgi:hypothetical protein
MQITFNDFVDLIGHATTGDPSIALEAWESFRLSDHFEDDIDMEIDDNE